jgi:hypothetical protein
MIITFRWQFVYGMLDGGRTPMLRRKDYTGQTYNRLTFVRRNVRQQDARGNSLWICRCICGTEKIFRSSDVATNRTKSCGCYAKDRRKDYIKFDDLTGKTFHRLTVIERTDRVDKWNHAYWNCRCSCGNMTVVNGHELKRDKTKSCGCLRRAQCAIIARTYRCIRDRATASNTNED